MTDAEAADFWHAGVGANSVRPEDLAAAIERAGLSVIERVDFGSEWGEAAQERSGAPGRRLLHTARLLRAPSRSIDEFGETAYRIMLGDCLWHVYRMIGKLHGAAFTFRAPGSPPVVRSRLAVLCPSPSTCRRWTFTERSAPPTGARAPGSRSTCLAAPTGFEPVSPP